MAAAELNNPVSLMHAPGVAQIFFSDDSDEPYVLKNMKA